MCPIGEVKSRTGVQTDSLNTFTGMRVCSELPKKFPFSLSTVHGLSVLLGFPKLVSDINVGAKQGSGSLLAIVSTSPATIVGVPLHMVDALEEVPGCSPSSRSVERATIGGGISA